MPVTFSNKDYKGPFKSQYEEHEAMAGNLGHDAYRVAVGLPARGGGGSGGSGPVSGATPKAQSVLGGGGKGGKKAYDLTDPKQRENFLEARAKYNNDGNFGYYNDQGRWVGALTDAFDGGGQDQYGTAFYGGGPLSMIGNIMKFRPLGMAREKDDQGEYLVDRADIGYRNIKDMAFFLSSVKLRLFKGTN